MARGVARLCPPAHDALRGAVRRAGRGLERVLELLDHHGAAATFYVPGATAERHPDAVRRILAAGHGSVTTVTTT